MILPCICLLSVLIGGPFCLSFFVFLKSMSLVFVFYLFWRCLCFFFFVFLISVSLVFVFYLFWRVQNSVFLQTSDTGQLKPNKLGHLSPEFKIGWKDKIWPKQGNKKFAFPQQETFGNVKVSAYIWKGCFPNPQWVSNPMVKMTKPKRKSLSSWAASTPTIKITFMINKWPITITMIQWFRRK